jgi:hypothetical protein
MSGDGDSGSPLEERNMPATREEVQQFARFATEQLSNGGADLSIEELLDLWRMWNPTDEVYAANVAAIAASIEDFERGERGTPFDPHSTELRRELGLDDA